jgi:hypothetical protein
MSRLYFRIQGPVNKGIIESIPTLGPRGEGLIILRSDCNILVKSSKQRMLEKCLCSHVHTHPLLVLGPSSGLTTCTSTYKIKGCFRSPPTLTTSFAGTQSPTSMSSQAPTFATNMCCFCRCHIYAWPVGSSQENVDARVNEHLRSCPGLLRYMERIWKVYRKLTMSAYEATPTHKPAK